MSFCITVVSSSCKMSIALHETAFLGLNIDIEPLPVFRSEAAADVDSRALEDVVLFFFDR